MIGMLVPALLGAGPARITWESPVFVNGGERHRPTGELEQDGDRYRLISTRIREAKKGGVPTYASAGISYALEDGQEPPGTAVISVKDETAGTEFEREVSLLEVREKQTEWRDDFVFPVTVSGYDAESFFLGEKEIPAGKPLSDCGAELIAYLGLPAESYRVDAVDWDGEPFERDGILCRNATARGAKRIRNVEAVYGGQVLTPEIRGKQYIGIYERIAPETEPEPVSETPPETRGSEAGTEPAAYEEPVPAAPVPRPGLAERLMEWLTRRLTVVTFGAAFILLMSGTLLLLVSAGKKKNISTRARE